MKTICFLLGTTECRNYHNKGFAKYLHSLESTLFEGGLFKIKLRGKPLKDAQSIRELVEAVRGWDEVLEIPEVEHELISNAIK